MSLFSFLAFSTASGPQGYASVGLWACIRRYGLVSLASRLVCFGFSFLSPPVAARGEMMIATKAVDRNVASRRSMAHLPETRWGAHAFTLSWMEKPSM